MKTSFLLIVLFVLVSCAGERHYQQVNNAKKTIVGVVDSVYTTQFKQYAPKITHTLTWIKVGEYRIHYWKGNYKLGDTVSIKVKRMLY